MRLPLRRTSINCLAALRPSPITAWQNGKNLSWLCARIIPLLFVISATIATSGVTAGVKLGAPPTPTIAASGTTTFCSGGTVVLTATSAGATSYQWFDNGSSIAGATAQTYTVTGTGSYTVTATNASGTSAASAATQVTVNPTPATPTVTAGGSTAFCSGGSVVLTANASGATAYQWYLNNTAISGATAQSYTASTVGNYTVTATNSNGCTSAPSATTTVSTLPSPATPTIAASGPTTFCSGGSVILTASAPGAASYQWFIGGVSISGATSNTYTATASGNYTVVVTNASGCMSAASAATTVTVNPYPAAPTITAGGPTTFCSGGSVVLTANETGAVTYQWYFNGGSISGATTQTYTANTSGSYTVSVTNSSGCNPPMSAATIVTINPTPATPTITANGNTPICQGGSVLLTANGSGATAYQWFQGGVSISGATGSTYSASASGNYTVSATDANGCTSAASAATTVTIVPNPAAPTITAGGPTTFCNGGNVTLTANASGASSYQWFLNGTSISGATSNTYTASASGNYTVTITNSTGCTSPPSPATTVTVSAPPGTPTINASGPTSFCTGSSVTLTAVASGATAYQWYLGGASIAGATAQTYTANTSGNYTVAVTYSGGCVSSASAATTVTVYTPFTAPPTVSAGGPTTICQGNSVLLTVSGTDVASFQWFQNGTAISGATTQTYAVTASGNYTVTVTNPCNAMTSAPITITVNPSPTMPIVTPAGPVSFCAPGGVVLTALPAGAAAYQWFLNGATISGATGQTYTATASGSYTVTAINAQGCSSPPSSPVIVTAYPALTTPTISAGGPTTFCAGGSVTLTANVTGATTYQWSLNGGAISGATSQTYTATASGSYTVLATNPCSNATSAPTTVTVNPAPGTPVIGASGPTTFCAPGTVTLTATGSGASTYQWLRNDTVITGATTQTYTDSVSGSFTVTITNISGCSATSAATNVTVYPALAPLGLTISANGPTTFCAGNSVILTANATGATGYQWYFDGTLIGGATSQNYTATVSGYYSVSATNPCSTVTSAAATVTVNPVPATPTVTADGSTTLCAGDSVVLTANASGANAYQWFMGGTAISGATNEMDTATMAGSYTVTVTNSAGCTSGISPATTVKVNPLPAAPTITAGGPTTFCQGSSVVLAASPTGASGYQWFLGGSAIPDASSANYAGDVTGSYTVDLTDANGCTSPVSAAIPVMVNPAPATPTISAGGPTTFCMSDSVILTATGMGAVTYQWSLDGTPQSGVTTTMDTVVVSGSYTITITDVNGCTATSANTTVTVNPTPSTPLLNSQGATTFCAGDSDVLSANATGAATYQWFLNGALITGATMGDYTVDSSGSYTVSIIDANTCMSAVSSTTSVTVNPVPGIPAVTASGALAVCPGQSVQLTAIATGASSYQWYLNGAAVADSTNPTFTVTGAGNFSVTAENAFGCMSAPSDTSDVNNPCLPKADLSLVKTVSAGPYSIQKPVTYTLTITNNGPDSAVNVIVSDTLPGALGDPSGYGGTGPNPMYDGVNHILTWNIADMAPGATLQLTFDISIKSFGTIANTGYVASVILDPDTTNNHSTAIFSIAGDLFIPNLVTPNGDGKNDLFVVIGLNKYPNSSLRVYNRWGSEVYQSQNYNNDWGGSGLGDGTYYYILLVNTPTGQQAYKGWIEILH